MFYSHEILTDRKHGVATIWLVATLGSKSSLKKITRKAIMDVDVPNACGTITDPAAPMALRLQGNLLYGVSRVFSQQCAYVLTDMQSLRDRMRGISMFLKELEVDPSVVTTRPEQLNLQADPAFNVDLDLGFDLSSFDLSFTTETSSLLSPRTLPSSQTGSIDEENLLAPAPSFEVSSSHDSGGEFDFVFDDIEPGLQDDPQTNVSQPETEADSADQFQVREEDRQEDDNLFQISEDGTLIVRDAHERDVAMPDAILTASSDFIAQRGEDQRSEMAAHIEHNHVEDFYPVPADDDGLYLDDSEAHTRKTPQPPEPRLESGNVGVLPGTEEAEAEVDEENEVVTATAPHRAIKLKAVPFDNPAELPNRTLAEWNDHYLDFMASAHLEKLVRISTAQAKRNAAYWVLDQGLGEVDSNFREDYGQHPLAIFSGQTLIDSLLGPSEQPGGRKRPASAISEDAASGGSQRSKRIRSQSHEHLPTMQGRQGDLLASNEEDLDIVLGDDDIDIEVGRGEEAPLSDHLSDMPWNAYASSRPGSVRPGLSAARVSSSAHRRGTFDVNIPSSNVKRVSQLIRESPLDPRRRMLQSSVLGGSSNQDNTDLVSLGGDFEIDDDELNARLAGDLDEDFELKMPVEDMNTQETAASHWVSEKLEEEAFNFLEFLHTTIRKKEKKAAVETGHDGNTSMTFEELLPPHRNNEIVAAQGLLHVLSLATKGLIEVRQNEAFGDINLSAVDKLMEESQGGGEEVNKPIQV